jgi:DNA mismatch repair ATPase MutS
MDWQTPSFKNVRAISMYLMHSEVEARLDSVEEIKETTNYKIEDVASFLTRLPDLEKGLVRIHYGRVLAQ